MSADRKADKKRRAVDDQPASEDVQPSGTKQGTRTALSPDHKTLSVRVPLRFAAHGGRKLVVTPAGAEPWRPRNEHADNALLKAVARAFRWRKLLETGIYSSIDEMAKAEKINPSYVSRVLRLTLLAPDVVEGILNGTQSTFLRADDFLKGFPSEWKSQHAAISSTRLNYRNSSILKVSVRPRSPC